MYPNEELFSLENFPYCPTTAIEKALQVANQLEIERANMAAIPLANFANAYFSHNGTKSEPGWFNPFGESLYEQRAKDMISPTAARLFIKLVRDVKIPSWVLQEADVKLIQAAARE